MVDLCLSQSKIVADVWGKRNIKTVRELREKLNELNVSFDAIYTDAWDSFIAVFKSDNHIVGKEGTKCIEGNNCRLSHRIRQDFRKTCCFSKKLFNHFRAFE